MLTAGDTETVKQALQRMAMMRSYMRAVSSGKDFDESRLERVGLTAHQTKQMYRLLAIAKYEDRFVIPTSHKEGHMNAYRSQGSDRVSKRWAITVWGKQIVHYSYAATQ